MNNQEIVAKLWNLCNVLRDDGITYHQYVTELTYILFLKMTKETGTDGQIPSDYRWDQLVKKQGIELKRFYNDLLQHLGDNCTGRIREIYVGARSNIDEPKNLEKIITSIDALDWYSAKEEGLGNLYEGLLEKNANEKNSSSPRKVAKTIHRNIDFNQVMFTENILVLPFAVASKAQHFSRCCQGSWLPISSVLNKEGVYLNASYLHDSIAKV